MNLLGKCYQELAMLDLEVKQLEEAAREILAMDAMNKESSTTSDWFTRKWAIPPIPSWR
jgi:hypothetical protein